MKSRLAQTAALDTPVESVRYVFGKRLSSLRKLGIEDIRGLLNYYPFRYNDFSDITSIAHAHIAQKVVVLGRIDAVKKRRTAKGATVVEISVFDDSGLLKAAWFNQPWLAERFQVGQTVLLLGKLDHFNGYKSLSSPLYTIVAAATPTNGEKTAPGNRLRENRPGESDIPTTGISPVYRSSGDLSSNWIRRLVIEALKLVSDPLDPLPVTLRLRRGLISRQTALRQVHFPDSQQSLAAALRRLTYEEVFWVQLGLARDDSVAHRKDDCFSHIIDGGAVVALNDILPFTLTASQQRAIDEILADMAAPKRMKRMLLGDVGSGKTIVAAFALTAAAQSGWQAAMMAPTEVLANQFSASLGGLLDQLSISWASLTSATSAPERMRIRTGLSTGDIQVVFGTHALLEDNVCFKRLSLVVIDEQQRFGVDQRRRLVAKSAGCDTLSMTATPIPRSLALVAYGDVQTSYLDSRPLSTTITTRIIHGSERAVAYEAMRHAVTNAQQCYIVCPLIGERKVAGEPAGEATGSSSTSTAQVAKRRGVFSGQNTRIDFESGATSSDGDDTEHFIDSLFDFDDEHHVAAAAEQVEYLSRRVFPHYRLELLTSKLPPEQKREVMEEFRQGRIDILVSTTVIEVGVDVPNATVMLIEDADRFGLAQLHQLRGRVGRGKAPGEVFLSTYSRTETALERLKLLEQTTDGLKLAELDLKLRREGDITGVRQHGKGRLSLVNVIRDSELISQAHDDVVALLETDASLEQYDHQHLRYELETIYPSAKVENNDETVPSTKQENT
ncbi:MAG: ATP-dependent DNA helicase RecG [Coriobacteriales bacterium]|jgi:ATP-dependent DNA helicase RecG|nr:ATP-dependent DNA helicase RecG [Coriobacteriales bacterium]